MTGVLVFIAYRIGQVHPLALDAKTEAEMADAIGQREEELIAAALKKLADTETKWNDLQMSLKLEKRERLRVARERDRVEAEAAAVLRLSEEMETDSRGSAASRNKEK